MNLQQVASRAAAPVVAASSQLDRAVSRVGDLVRLELVLTALSAAIPLILIGVEGWPAADPPSHPPQPR